MIKLTFLKELMLIRQVNQECDIFHYCYFLNQGFKFQPNICNRGHDLLMSMNLSNIAILNIKSADYCCIISAISKIEPINYNDYKVKPLHVMLPKTSAYVKSCDRQTKWMNFSIEDDDLKI